MSAHNIEAGARWHAELDRILEESHLGIICLTPENQSSPWVLFEAGALAKTTKVARVIPYRVGLSETDVEYPLAQFQGVDANEAGTFKLLESINDAGNLLMTEEKLMRIFQKWWPDLEKGLGPLPLGTGKMPPRRTDRELIEEILELVRNQSRKSTKKRSLPRHSASFANSTNSDHCGKAVILLDTTVIHGDEGKVQRLTYELEGSISGFLDSVWFLLNEEQSIPTYTYGELWLLENAETGERLDNIGIEYCKSRGHVADSRPIRVAGITDGMRLRVVPIQS
jgi:hypothetical protein